MRPVTITSSPCSGWAFSPRTEPFHTTAAMQAFSSLMSR